MNERQNDNFIDSLERLTSNDIAPKPQKKRRLFDLVGRGLWLLLALLLLSVAVWASSKVAGNLFDFITAEKNYQGIAGEFSPITGVTDRPAGLKPGKDSYPLPGFDALLAGDVSYPDDDDPVIDLPVVNPGIDTSPSPEPPVESESGEPSKQPPEPPVDDRPIEKEDPLLSTDLYEEFCDKLTAMQSEYKNEDIFAWIYLPGSNINYPVVRGPDNDFYLDKEPSKKWNNAGSIFMDYRNDKNLLNNPYTVIYGHNIRYPRHHVQQTDLHDEGRKLRALPLRLYLHQGGGSEIRDLLGLLLRRRQGSHRFYSPGKRRGLYEQDSGYSTAVTLFKRGADPDPSGSRGDPLHLCQLHHLHRARFRFGSAGGHREVRDALNRGHSHV